MRCEAPLTFAPGSYALLSEDHSDIAVVFVHGFGGHPEKTWRNFQELADSCASEFPALKKCDLYFFKYASVSAHITDSSEDLRKFLDHIFPSPPAELFRVQTDDLPRYLQPENSTEIALPRGHCRYRHLQFCAHSEGALVVRYAILELIKQFEDELQEASKHVSKLPPLDNSYQEFAEARAKAIEEGDTQRVMRLVASYLISRQRKPQEEKLRKESMSDRLEALQTILKGKLRLFAPAQLGASPSRLLGVLLASAGLGDVFRVLLNASPAYQQMAQNSQLLGLIRDNTQSYADKYDWMNALKAAIIWGQKDEVVVKAEYGCDRRYSTEPNQTHISVCKPTPTYKRPLEFVSDGLF